MRRLMPGAALVAATALLLGPVPAARGDVPTGEASVALPLTVPATTHARIAALARTSGHAANRAAAVRALAPPPQQAAAVRSWALSHGFQVVASTPWLVEVRGDAPALAAALGTTAGTRTVHGRAYAVARGPLQVPPALQGLVGTPSGLDERPLYRHHAPYGGGDLQVMQDLPVRGSASGAGVTVGTLNLSGWHPSDLTEFAQSYNLAVPSVTSVVLGSGHVQATPTEDASGDQSEVALDAEAIAGTAPGAAQRMYFAGNSEADVQAALAQMVTDATNGQLQVASSSWGVCESSLSADDRATETNLITSLVAAGATLFAASGDSGSTDCNGATGVDWPAAEAHTVGVGGVSVTGDAASGYSAPVAWSSSGGGCSQFVPAPAFQTTTDCAGFRAVPDIASLADPQTGFRVYDSPDGWNVVGGTSLAAPTSAAGLASFLSSQSDKSGAGNVLTALYAAPSSDFTDVTSGGNGGFSARAGYDEVTGLGVPLWRLLGAALKGVPTPAAPTPSSSPWLYLPTTSTSLTIPVTYGYNGGRLDSAGLREGTDHGSAAGCPTTPSLPVTPPATSNDLPTVTLPAGTADGPVQVTLTGSDSAMGCRGTTRTVLLDSHAPVVTEALTYTGTTRPSYRLTWGATDPAPSSGLDGYDVTVTDTTTGAKPLVLTGTSTRSATLTAAPGHGYRLQVRAYDRAGNASTVRTITFRAPNDDRSASLSSGWTRRATSGDYAGSHVSSARAGASYRFTFTGRALTAGVLKGPYGGYADVYVDGVRKQRISLYASRTLYRQGLRLVTFTRAGRHTVTVRVVGSHPAGSRGNAVYLDSLAVAL